MRHFIIQYQKALLLLLGIFLLALILRVVNLSATPNALHVDELHVGYQGYSIVTTGKDIFGNILPVYINRIGDFRPTGIFYLAGISTALFGLEIFAVRLPSAIFGALTTIPLFILVYLITKNRSIALLSSLLLAISPWHIVASRATSESVIALFLTVTGITLLVYALQSNKRIYLVVSFLLLFSSYFFYHIPRLFIPAFLVLFSLFYFVWGTTDKKNKGQKKSLFLVCGAMIITTVIIAFTNFGTGRLHQTSILANKDIPRMISALQDGDRGDVFAARIFHNKPVVFAKTFLDQYVSYFSIEYLFLRGGLPDRYTIDHMGLLYYIELPLLVVGWYFILRKRTIFTIIPIAWIICGPLAAAITLEDSPNIQRSIFMLPAIQIIEAYGLYYAYKILTPKIRYIALGCFILALLINMIYFSHMYVIHSPEHISFRRNDGNKEMFAYLSEHEQEYDAIYVPTYEDMPMYYTFFKRNTTPLHFDSPEQYKERVHLGKYIFVPSSCPTNFVKKEEFVGKRALFVSVATCQIDGGNFQELWKVVRKDSTDAFIISAHKE